MRLKAACQLITIKHFQLSWHQLQWPYSCARDTRWNGIAVFTNSVSTWENNNKGYGTTSILMWICNNLAGGTSEQDTTRELSRQNTTGKGKKEMATPSTSSSDTWSTVPLHIPAALQYDVRHHTTCVCSGRLRRSVFLHCKERGRRTCCGCWPLSSIGIRRSLLGGVYKLPSYSSLRGKAD